MAEQPTVNGMMAAYALDAVDHAKASSGVDLDFSSESVRHVEAILTTMYESRPKGFLARFLKQGPSPEVLGTFTKMYGGYVGEVLRKLGGGEWYLDTEVAPGHTVIGLRKGDARVWPAAKVGKRLTNGPEDNVWHYFQIILKEHWRLVG